MPDNINPTLNFNSSSTTTSNQLIQPSNPFLSFLSPSSSTLNNSSPNLSQQQQQQPSLIKFENYYHSLDENFKQDIDDDDDDEESKRNDIELIDSDEIFDLIRSITDPEHPLTLEDLSVVSSDQITVTYPTSERRTSPHTARIHHNNPHLGHHDRPLTDKEDDGKEDEDYPHVLVRFTPTIPHCSMATLIGLTIRVRLLRSLPDRFKVDIKIKEGTHQSENSVNKQLNDKERVAAALENSHLLNVVQQCLSTAHLRGGHKK